MIKKDEIQKLSNLARISISTDEIESLTKDIDSILTYVGQIQEIALNETVSDDHSIRNIVREDDSPDDSGIFTDKTLKEAPRRDGNYIKVKNIL